MAEKKTIRAILFDIDDTLYSTSEFTRQARWQAVQAMIDMGLNRSCQELFQELNEVITEFTSNYPHHFDKLLLRIPPQCYSKINKAILVAAAVVAYHDAKHYSLKPYDDALEFIRFFSDFPLIKGIITDGLEIKQAEKLVRLKIHRYLTGDAIFISDQIGVSKNNPKIYRYVCEKLRLPPQQILYIGDHPLRDIDAANAIGIITVRIRKEGGKYYDLEGKTRAHHDIASFEELLLILQRDYQW